MADKFPEIADVAVDTTPTGGNFLAREKEVLGDEFATADDKVADDQDDDDEFDNFQSEPAAAEAAVTTAEPAETVPVKTPSFDDTTTKFGDLDLDDSEKIKEWKTEEDARIKQRDATSAKKLAELKQEAQKATDDFYENYNNKKDENIADTKKQQEEFIAKRDAFIGEGTVWDRVNELLSLSKTSDSIDEEHHRDKTRFKEILLSLKGKDDVPGSGGVSQ